MSQQATADRQTTPVDSQPGDSLTHLCADHPFYDSAPCVVGHCKSFCGYRFKSDEEEYRDFDTPDDCVVCLAMAEVLA